MAVARTSNDILFKFVGDTKSLDRATKGASRSMGKTQQSSISLTKAMGALGVAFGAQQVLGFAGDAIQMAVAAEEVDARFQAVFGSAVDFRKALEEWGDVAGVTETRAEDLASQFGNLAQTQGLTAEASAQFAIKTAELAGDIASFSDLDPEQVFDALNKGLLTTEKEGLKAFGLAITAAEVDTRAMILATKDGRTEISKADKAYASYEIAVEQAGKAIGDLEATQDSSANVQRQLTASMQESQEEIGRRLLPVYQDLLEVAVQISPALVLAADGATILTRNIVPLAEGMGAAAEEGASVTDRLKGVAGALKDIIVLNSPAALVFLGLKNLLTDVEIKAGKAKTGIKNFGRAEEDAAEEARDLAFQVLQAASATDELRRKSFDADGVIKIFAGDLFAAARAAQEFRRSSGETIGSLFAGGSGSGQTEMAHGGTLQSGESALVGERGPEVITAGQSLRVHPNGTGGGGTVVNITVNALDPDAAAVAVADALRSYTDRYGPL